jgi:ketosteroid isomerase-like protein
MSRRTDLLREIAAAMSSGAPDRISDWFTEDFRLHEPGKPALPVGHEGARQMMEAGRQNRMRAGVQTPAKVEILDMIEEGDRVAVRWQVTATAHNGNPYEGSCVAIYRRGLGHRCSGTLALKAQRGLKCLLLTTSSSLPYLHHQSIEERRSHDRARPVSVAAR